MSKKNKILLAVFIIFALAGMVGGYLVYKNKIAVQTKIDAAEKVINIKDNATITDGEEAQPLQEDGQAIKGEEQPLTGESATSTIRIKININGNEYTENYFENTSVYRYLEILKENKKIDFTSQDYGEMGSLVEEINGLKNSVTDNKYWFYYVNGASASVGASQYILKPSDTIEWKYEKSNF